MLYRSASLISLIFPFNISNTKTSNIFLRVRCQMALQRSIHSPRFIGSGSHRACVGPRAAIQEGTDHPTIADSQNISPSLRHELHVDQGQSPGYKYPVCRRGGEEVQQNPFDRSRHSDVSAGLILEAGPFVACSLASVCASEVRSRSILDMVHHQQAFE